LKQFAESEAIEPFILDDLIAESKNHIIVES
jgi:hypothetical protein